MDGLGMLSCEPDGLFFSWHQLEACRHKRRFSLLFLRPEFRKLQASLQHFCRIPEEILQVLWMSVTIRGFLGNAGKILREFERTRRTFDEILRLESCKRM